MIGDVRVLKTIIKAGGVASLNGNRQPLIQIDSLIAIAIIIILFYLF